MTAEALLYWLLDGTLAVSAALLLVFAFRRPLRRVFGARVAYAAWTLVPLMLFAASLPRPQAGSVLPQALLVLHPGVLVGAAAPQVESAISAWATVDWPLLLSAAWFVGAVLAVLRFHSQQRRFVADLGPLLPRDDGTWIAKGANGPAVIGAWRPRIVVPPDFDTRYSRQQATLVLAHERAHLHRGDARANLAAIVLRCLQWFNPLLPAAATRFRLDQELACDAAVLARYPAARRSYADAMLNAQLAVPGLPVGCHWQSSQSLKERILMLKYPQPDTRRRHLGALVLCVVLTGSSYAAWALRPAEPLAGPASPTAAATPVQTTPAPAYPPEALAKRQGGRVILKLLVATDGSVRNAVVERSTPEGVFDAAALEAVRKWTIAPRMENGRPVDGWVRVPIDFDPGKAQTAPGDGGHRTPPPAYPAAALAANQGGRVMLKVLVAADGSVKDAVVEESQPQGVFDAATLEAVWQWEFAPRLENGEPVEGWVRVPVTFEPDHEEPAASGHG